MIREEPSDMAVSLILPTPVTESVEKRVIPVLMLPEMVTLDCASATPGSAATTASASSDFFMMVPAMSRVMNARDVAECHAALAHLLPSRAREGA